jgi:phosphatidylserine/phosphatidylglycerophosphate/cardiolipin synthase-like enzyme
MKLFNYKILILYLSLLLTACSHAPLNKASVNESAESIEVHFSPKGDCTKTVVFELSKAKHQVLIQAYSFTSAPIAKAVVEAHKRGVVIKAILDKSQRSEKYSSADFLANSGISVKIDARHAIAHNKVMVIDSTVVITGSFNFTKAAEENNAENLLIMRNRDLAAKYIENWWVHEEHSETYKGKAEQ